MVSPTTALRALSASGAFASRAFLPLLVIAVVARFPELLTWLPFVQSPAVVVPSSLEWLLSTPALGVLALLAAGEMWAEHDTDVRDVVGSALPVLRGVAAALGTLALIDPESAALVREVVSSAGIPTTVAATAAIIVGVVTFVLSGLRERMLATVHSALDDLRLLRPIAWLEDVWSVGGLLLAIVAPFLAIACIAVLLVVGWLARRSVEAHAEKQRVPCTACGHRARPEAVACASCSVTLVPATSPGSFLWPDRWAEAIVPPSEIDERRRRDLELIGQGRCPRCAEARTGSDIDRGLHGCGWSLEMGTLRASMHEELGRRMQRLALPALGIGLVPIIGPAIAYVTARARLASPARRYLPLGSRLRARVRGWLLAIPLLLLAGIPLASGLAALAFVAIQGWTWRLELARGS